MASDIVISVIEDDQSLCDSIVDVLANEGWRVSGFYSAESFNQAVDFVMPDILVADLNLPGDDGLSVVRHMRATHPEMKIIVLTARNEQAQRFEGYEAGADVFLTKPSSAKELLTVVRRLESSVTKTVLPSSETFFLDCDSLKIMGSSGLSVEVTQRESLLLQAMLSGGQEGVDVESLVAVDPEESMSKQALQVRIVRLREKLATIGAPRRAISAIRGHGYRLTFSLVLT
ncbi:MAG: response regulator transcription factor [Orrella sp.]